MLEKAFHEAIRQGELGAQLIYGDWLQEQGRLEEAAMLQSGRWCFVPPGLFWMGSNYGEPGKEQVEIRRGFYIGAYLVTQGEWRKIMGNNPSNFKRRDLKRPVYEQRIVNGYPLIMHDSEQRRINNLLIGYSPEDLDNFPVESVSWIDIQDYICKRNAEEASSGWVYQLPSEAEWEYACRCTLTTQQECSFDYYLDKPTNEISSHQANFNGTDQAFPGKEGPNLERTTIVGSYQPNQLGLFDMHGNVWEWCEDVYSFHSFEKVVRGASWGGVSLGVRTGIRDQRKPDRRDCYTGFRLVRVAADPPSLDTSIFQNDEESAGKFLCE